MEAGYFCRNSAVDNNSTMVLVQFAPELRSFCTRFHNGNPVQDHQLVQIADSVEWAGLLELPQ